MWCYIHGFIEDVEGELPSRDDPHALQSPSALSLVPMSSNGYPLLGLGFASPHALPDIAQTNRCPRSLDI